MRCARVDELADRYVDGLLDAGLAAGVADHERRCARCARRIADARRLAGALARPAALRAPAGFGSRVMDSVYRAALAGIPEPADGGEDAALAARGREGRLRTYRRLGLSFMLSAAVFAAMLVVPQGFLPAAVRAERVAAGFSRDGTSSVKDALDGAGRTVQDMLGKGGPAARPRGGVTR
jgi:anti-sigma factor RsiW